MSVSKLRLIVGLAFLLAVPLVLGILRHASAGTIIAAGFLYLSALIVSIAFLLDYPRLPRQPRTSEVAEDLAKQNLLSCTRYCVDRAFRVEALHQEGPHYFLELESGAVLHLCGSYLCDYEPSDTGVRHFPCTQFTIRRHAESGEALDILCEGLVIEPEVEAPPFDPCELAQLAVPADGEVLHNAGFDQLMRERTEFRLRMQ